MPSQETTTDEAVGTDEIPHSAPDIVFAEQFKLITRRITRALLRHSQLPSFHENTNALYSALHDFFEQWSLRQERVAAMRVTPDAAARLLRYGETLLFTPATDAQRAEELVASAPHVPLATLKRELHAPQVRVSLAPMAEVLELARVLDNAQGLHTPFGTLNVMHMIALGAALCPLPNMRALLLLVSASLEHCLTCAAVFYEWALIDRENAESLLALRLVLERSSGARPADVVAGELAGPLEMFGNGFVDEMGTERVGKLSVEVSGKQTGSVESMHEVTSEAQEDDEGEMIVSQTHMDFWRQLCN